jgi:hypothetical protein
MKLIYWLVFGFIAWILYAYLPFHQDEFLHFHSLAYQLPNFQLNAFKEGFGAYEKFFPLGLSVYFPFLYTGNLQGILLWPFYVSMPILEAKMAYSLLSLALFFVLILRTFSMSSAGKWFLFLLLPIYIAVLRDAGPVNVALIIFVLSFHLTNKLAHPMFGWLAALCLSFLWSLAFYDKLFFVYLMPSVLVFSLNRLSFEAILKRDFLIKMGLALAGFSMFVLVYLLADIRVRQFQSVELGNFQLPFIKVLASPGDFTFWEERRIVLNTIVNQFDFSFYVLRHLNYYDFIQANVWNGLSWFGIVFVGLLVLEFKHADAKARWYLAAFVVMALTFLVLGKIRFGHHTVFLFIPLLGFWFDGRRPVYLKSLMVWLSLNILVFGINLVHSQAHESLRTDYRDLVKKTKVAKPAIVNFDSWNYYYLRNLDADHSLVTWVDLQDSVQTNRLFALSKQLNLPIINVSGSAAVWKQNWSLIQNSVDSVVVDRTFPSNPIISFRIK